MDEQEQNTDVQAQAEAPAEMPVAEEPATVDAAPAEGAAPAGEGAPAADGGGEGTVEDPREQYFEMIRSRYPDEKFDNDIDYYKKGLGLVSELDDTIHQYDEKNQELFDLLDDEPLLGLVLADFKEGKSLPYIIGHYFDKDEVFSDQEDEDDFIAGAKEREKRIANKKKKEETFSNNFKQTATNFDDFAKQHEMNDEEAGEFRDKMLKILQSAQEGLISPEFLGVMFKGLAYDADTKMAEEQGRINGRNEKIEMQHRTFAGDGLPNTDNGSSIPSRSNSDTAIERMKRHMEANDVWARGGYTPINQRK